MKKQEGKSEGLLGICRAFFVSKVLLFLCLSCVDSRPKFSVKQFAKFQAWKNPEDLERILDGLRKAGLPE